MAHSDPVLVADDRGNVYSMKPVRPPRRVDETRPLKPAPNSGFIMVWHDEIRRLGLSGAQYDVFFVLAEMVDPRTGAVRYDIGDLTEKCHVSHRESTLRIIRQLCERGAISRIPGRRELIAINPKAAWRGTLAERDLALFEWENLTREGASA